MLQEEFRSKTNEGIEIENPQAFDMNYQQAAYPSKMTNDDSSEEEQMYGVVVFKIQVIN